MQESNGPFFAPDSAEEFAALLSRCYEKKERVLITYGDEAAGPTVTTFSMKHLNNITRIDKVNSRITFQCGVRVSEILAMLAESVYGKFPFDQFAPAESIGHCFTHKGVFRADSLYALKVVLPNGTLMNLGSGAHTSVSGYNAMDCFLGTKNVLGIPVEYAFRLMLPEQENDAYRARFALDTEPHPLEPEERKFILRLKTMYDPVNIINTFEI
ncbi:MAG: FAD-binding protein [Fibrobacterota bacterium]